MVASVVLRFGFGAACEHHNGIRQCVARSHKPQIAPCSRRAKLPDLRRGKKGVALQGGPKLPHDQETEKADKRDEMSAEEIPAPRRRICTRSSRYANRWSPSSPTSGGI